MTDVRSTVCGSCLLFNGGCGLRIFALVPDSWHLFMPMCHCTRGLLPHSLPLIHQIDLYGQIRPVRVGTNRAASGGRYVLNPAWRNDQPADSQEVVVLILARQACSFSWTSEWRGNFLATWPAAHRRPHPHLKCAAMHAHATVLQQKVSFFSIQIQRIAQFGKLRQASGLFSCKLASTFDTLSTELAFLSLMHGVTRGHV